MASYGSSFKIFSDGTTDVTRTVFHAQNPGEYFKKMFTLVLKGHIENALMTFPSGISGVVFEICGLQT